MRVSRQEPGIAVSGVAHAVILLLSLVALSSAPPFANQEEGVTVDLVSESELSAITKGDKTAKEIKPEQKPRVDKLADLIKEDKQDPGEAKRDVPVPPSRPQDLEVAEKDVAPPPQKAEAAKPEEAAAKEEPKPLKEDEAVAQPPRRPAPPKVEDKPKPVEKKAEPKPDGKQLAKLIDETKPQEKPKAKPAEREKEFNLSDIKQLLDNKDKPQSSAAKGRELNRTASLGTATANAPKMSLSQRDGLNALVRSRIMECWTAPPPSGPLDFQLHVRMSLRPDGALLAEPEVVNSSVDPAFRAWASSLTRAILRCAPFKIPAQYDPFYADWRVWNVLFDPKDFQG